MKHFALMKFKFTLQLALVLSFTFSNLIFGQTSQYSGTTLEEYNYITKGYKIQVASGLDMKTGYSFRKEGPDSKVNVRFGDISRDVQFLTLYKYDWEMPRGLLMIYQKSGNEPLFFCIPNGYSDDDIWNLAFKDINEYNDQSQMLFTMVWALFKNWTFTEGYCFPEGSKITLNNGQDITIEELTTGQKLLSVNTENNTIRTSEVKEVIVHDKGNYKLTKITAEITNSLFASNETIPNNPLISIEATNNHPILTDKGVKQMGQLQVGDVLYHYDSVSKQLNTAKITIVNSDCKTVDKVYNVVTDDNTYLVNDFVVMMK